MAAPLRGKILAAGDIDHEDHDVPEWDGVKVRIRGLTGTQRDSFEAKGVAMRRGGQDIELRMQNFRSRLLVKCLYDPDTDKRIFEESDVPKLGSKAGKVLDRLFDIAQRLSGMGQEAMEDARGNSPAAQSGSSTTD